MDTPLTARSRFGKLCEFSSIVVRSFDCLNLSVQIFQNHKKYTHLAPVGRTPFAQLSFFSNVSVVPHILQSSIYLTSPCLKGTSRPDWILIRVVSLESPLKRTSTAIGVKFFSFTLEYFKRLKTPEPLHAELNPILLLVRFTVCMCSNRDLFRRTVLQKCGRDINCSLGCGLHPSFRNPNQSRGALWRIFSSNESVQANSETGFYADSDPKTQ